MRKFIRHPSDIPIEIIVESDADSGNYNLTKISLGGLSFKGNRFYEPGSIVTIRISVVRPVYQTRGRVVWCRKKGEFYEIGIQFIEAGDAYQCRMVEQVCHIEHYRKEVAETEGRTLSSQEAAYEWILKYASEFPGTGGKVDND